MGSSSQSLKFEKVTWDEVNIEIFLFLLVEEIDAGNRPSSHFTRAAWNTITQKEFGLWEKLLLEETGLGYDHSTGRIDADLVWWSKKLQEKPEYRRFRTHGPLHLELQEKVFWGIVATGYMEYIPHCDPSLKLDGTQGFTGEELYGESDGLPQENDSPNVDADVEVTKATMQPQSKGAGMKAKGPKRKRTRTSSTKPTVGDVNENFTEVLNVMKAESASSIMMRNTEKSIGYGDAIDMMRALPWMEVDSEFFTTGLVLLEDEKKRIAFSHIVDLGEKVVKNWMEAWKK